MKEGSPSTGYRRPIFSTALLLFQGTLSVTLLVCAGLFVRSLRGVESTRLGYDPDSLIYMEGTMRGVALTGDEQSALDQRLLDAAKTMPGVQDATLVGSVPFLGGESQGVPYVPGKDSLGRFGRYTLQAASPSYFRTLGTRIIRGRAILPTDRANTERVAVISESMANAVWPGEDPIGRQFRIGDDTMPMITVVGVAENVRGQNIAKGDDIWYYLPLPQHDRHRTQLFVRMSVPPKTSIEPLRRRLQALMPGASYLTATPFADLVGQQQTSWRFGATLFTAFGALALLLAAVGLYSVTAHAVAQRSRELGVRIALGATTGNVFTLVVGQAILFALAGMVLGGSVALGAGRWIQPLLFAESARDPLVYAGAGIVLFAVTLIAAARPAVRATRVDPVEVLRGEG